MNRIDINIAFWNKALRYKTPDDIIQWALTLTENRIVTTSFGVYSSILLSTITKHDPDIKVIWCDTLLNLASTYDHAERLIKQFNLNIKQYQPLIAKEATNYDGWEHDKFSEIVKLEPFRRALQEHQPDLWFTNIRVRQTELRNKKNILSVSKDGIIKVSPFYYWSDADLDAYLTKNSLPKNPDYFDPVKALKNRECGIHLQ